MAGTSAGAKKGWASRKRGPKRTKAERRAAKKSADRLRTPTWKKAQKKIRSHTKDVIAQVRAGKTSGPGWAVID